MSLIDRAHTPASRLVSARATSLPWDLNADESEALSQLTGELKQRALLHGDFVLSSGSRSKYYLDVKRAIKGPTGFRALGLLVASAARHFEATAVGGLTMGADAVAHSAFAGGAEINTFSVRKKPKQHGLGKWIEGPALSPADQCLIVDDVVTSGQSVLDAVERMEEEGLAGVAILAVVDRLDGGEERLRHDARIPFFALTTIDEIYPDRPDGPLASVN